MSGVVLTGQQCKLLEVLGENCGGVASPVALQNAFRIRFKGSVGNVYEVLLRVAREGFVTKLDDGSYSLTDRARKLLSKASSELESVESVLYSKAECLGFHKKAVEKDVLRQISSGLCPGIIGLEDEREAVLLSMVSEGDVEGDVNRVSVLFDGPPSCGKSNLVESAKRQLWGVLAGPETSKAGLVGVAKGSQYTPGLLQLANNSVLFIDEIEKFSRVEQEGLLTAMTSGRVHISKDQVNKVTNASVRVVATTNNRRLLIEPLLSRFDLIFDVEPASAEVVENIVRQSLNNWNRCKDGVLGEDFFGKYVKYAKSFPSQFPSDRSRLAELVIRELGSGCLVGKEVRKIQAVYRLSVAVAKLRLKSLVDEEDLKEALRLVSKSK